MSKKQDILDVLIIEKLSEVYEQTVIRAILREKQDLYSQQWSSGFKSGIIVSGAFVAGYMSVKSIKKRKRKKESKRV